MTDNEKIQISQHTAQLAAPMRTSYQFNDHEDIQVRVSFQFEQTVLNTVFRILFYSLTKFLERGD